MFLGIAAVALLGLLVVVVAAVVSGSRKLPVVEHDVVAPMTLPLRLTSLVCVRAEGVGDTVRCLARDEVQAWALVDGIEGHADPEGAVQTIAAALEGSLRGGAPWASLCEGVAAANRALVEATPAALPAPGAGLAVLAREGRQLRVGHLGNVRVYRLRGGLADLLTIDCSPLGDMVRSGRIPRKDADTLLEDPGAPHRQVLTRALGQKPEVELLTQVIDLTPGDAFLVLSGQVALCTSRLRLVEARAAAAGDGQAWLDGVLDGPGMKPSLWGSRGAILLRAPAVHGAPLGG